METPVKKSKNGRFNAATAGPVRESLFRGHGTGPGSVPSLVGKFTLTYPIHWGESVLQPGNYTITIKSTGTQMIALIRNSDGDAVTHVVSGARRGNTSGANALLLREKDGQLTIHSLALADLGMVLIYDPTLGRETVQEARAGQTVPVTWAKK